MGFVGSLVYFSRLFCIWFDVGLKIDNCVVLIVEID